MRRDVEGRRPTRLPGGNPVVRPQTQNQQSSPLLICNIVCVVSPIWESSRFADYFSLASGERKKNSRNSHHATVEDFQDKFV